jgi:hypothetical protein
MLLPLTISSSRSGIAAASLPLPQPTTLDGGYAPAAGRRGAALRLRKHETRFELTAIESRQGDHSYRSLYVLGASLALATLAMIGVALAFQ